MQVTIIDTRPKWVKREDDLFICQTYCKSFKRCSSRFGSNCKRFGGTEIPIIRSNFNEKKKSNYRSSGAKRI